MRYQRLRYRYAMVLAHGAPTQASNAVAARRRVVIAQPYWRPSADVYETPEAVYVTVELAGVAPEDVEAVLYEDALVVHGERRLCTAAGGGVYHTAEIRQGPLRVELALPACVDIDRVEGRMDQGLLRLKLPKVEGSDRDG
jgi:HSP20 family protein